VTYIRTPKLYASNEALKKQLSDVKPGALYELPFLFRERLTGVRDINDDSSVAERALARDNFCKSTF
jgi:hypothetical protein